MRPWLEQHWRTLLLRAVLAIVALFVLYLVAANIFLTFALRRLTSTPRVGIDYASAWTLWPGRVELRDARVRSRVDVLEWMVEARQATVRLSLIDLVRRQVNLHRIDASGVRFRMRFNVEPRDADDPRVIALPPIPGFDDPPLSEAVVPKPPELESRWRFRLDESDARVEELWIGAYRFEGDARVRGGFVVQPHERVAVLPSSFDAIDGVVTLGPYEIARAIEGTTTCEIAEFDPRVVRGRDVVRQVTSGVHLDAQVPSVEGVKFFLPPSFMTIEDGSGALHVDASVVEGRMEEPSVVDFVTDRARVVLRGFEIVGSAKARWSAERGGTYLVVDTPIASIFRREKGPPLTLFGSHAALTTPGADLADLDFGGLTARFDRATTSDARWFTDFTTEHGKLGLYGGTVEIVGDIAIDKDLEAHGHTAAVGRGVRAKLGKADIDANVEAFIDLAGDLGKKEVAVTRGTVIVSRADVGASEHHRDLTARIAIGSGELDWREGFGFHLRTSASADDSLAVMDLAQVTSFIETVTKPLTSEAATGKAELDFHRGLFSMELRDLASGVVRGEGALERNRDHLAAAFAFRSGPPSVGIRVDDEGVHTTPFADDDWVKKNHPALGPTRGPTPPRAARTSTKAR